MIPELEKIEVGDILSFSQKFHRRGNITPPGEKWEVIAKDDNSMTIKSCFDGQLCCVALDYPQAKKAEK